MSFIDLLGKRNPGEDAERYLDRVEAAARVESRFEARRRAAITQPKGTMLLGQGNADTVFDLIRYYQQPVEFMGGFTGVRLFFARMSDEERSWIAAEGITLYRCGEHFIVQPLDSGLAPLKLTFDGNTVKRVCRSAPGRIAEPRSLGHRGTRLG